MSDKETCKAEGCDKEVRAKGYCDRHYGQWRKGKLPKPRYRGCNAEGCHKPRARRGLCEEHFAKEYPGKKAAAAKEATVAAAPAAATEGGPEPSAGA